MKLVPSEQRSTMRRSTPEVGGPKKKAKLRPLAQGMTSDEAKHVMNTATSDEREALRQRLQARARPLGARVREATREAAAAPEIRSSRKTKELVFVPEGRSGKKKGKAHGEDGARGKQGKGRPRY